MRSILAATLALAAAACAGYSIQSTQTGREGYVVYEPEPYILRTPSVDDSGKLTGYAFQTIYLPNRRRGYRVRTWAGFGKADFEFNFTNGWMLSGIADKSDNTKVLETLSKFVPAPLPGLGGAPGGGDGPPADNAYLPTLFRLEYDDCGRVCGLTQVEVGDEALRRCRPVPRRPLSVGPPVDPPGPPRD